MGAGAGILAEVAEVEDSSSSSSWEARLLSFTGVVELVGEVDRPCWRGCGEA